MNENYHNSSGNQEELLAGLTNWIELLHYPGRKFYPEDFPLVEDLIRERMEKFRDEPLVVNYFSSAVTNLTLVDLPGLTFEVWEQYQVFSFDPSTLNCTIAGRRTFGIAGTDDCGKIHKEPKRRNPGCDGGNGRETRNAEIDQLYLNGRPDGGEDTDGFVEMGRNPACNQRGVNPMGR